MAQITAAREMPLEGMPDAPDEEWIKAWLQQQNGFGRQVGAAFQRAITIGENTTSIVKEIDLVHGQSVTVANPLSVPIQGIFAIGCTGLTVGSDGKPTGGLYDLAIPDLQAKPSTKGDGSWIVQANYALTPSETSGQIGETQTIQRVKSASVTMTSPNALNVCAQPSITCTSGTYEISAMVGFFPAATTSITQLLAAISATSATVPASDTSAVPTDGEVSTRWSTAANVVVNENTIQIPPIPLTVADGATATRYLVARATFSAAALTVFGWMQVKRTFPYLTGRTGRVKLFFFGG